MVIFSPFWRIFSNFGTVIFSAAVDCDIMLLLPPLHPLLEGPLSLLDAVHENIGTGLKKDNKIGFGEAGIQQLIDTIIQIHFILRQIEGGKDLIFGKNIVANGYLVEQVLLLELYLLAIARKKEKNLRLKGIAAG